MWRPLWQTPVATVRTSTSRPHGLSTSTSSIVSGSWTLRKTAAFMVLTRRLAGVHRQHLPRDAARHVAAEEHGGVDDVVRGDEALERVALDHRLAHLVHRDAAHLRLPGDDAVDAVALHRTRRHAVHANLGRELQRHPVRHADLS